MVIAADFPELILHKTQIAGKKGEPYAIQTKMCWVLMGGLKSTQKPSIESNFMPTSRMYSESYWAIENYGKRSKNDAQL